MELILFKLVLYMYLFMLVAAIELFIAEVQI